jgi:hypothetical protein
LLKTENSVDSNNSVVNMKRSLEEPMSEPRKSSRSSLTETENTSSLKVIKKNRRDSEGQSKVATTSSKKTKPVAPGLTPAEYARQKASAKEWAVKEYQSEVSSTRLPPTQPIVAPQARAETATAVSRKTRKSVSISTIVPSPVARGVQAESVGVVNRPTTVIPTPLIKIERPRPHQ